MENEEMKVWCSTEDWCPVTAASQILGRKWHPVIIHRLVEKNQLSFNDLKREAKGISSKVLSETLDDLREKNIVEKEVISESPKKVSYALTPVGESLEAVILGMEEWGRKRLKPAETLDSSFEIPQS